MAAPLLCCSLLRNNKKGLSIDSTSHCGRVSSRCCMSSRIPDRRRRRGPSARRGARIPISRRRSTPPSYGDTILLRAGQTFVGHYTLRAKSGSGVIVDPQRRRRERVCPGDGTRLVPVDARRQHAAVARWPASSAGAAPTRPRRCCAPTPAPTATSSGSSTSTACRTWDTRR